MASEGTLRQYEAVCGRLASAVRSRGEVATPRALAKEIGRRKLGLRSAKFYASAVRWRYADDPLATAEFNRIWNAAKPDRTKGKRPKPSISSHVIAMLRKHGLEVARPRKYAAHVCDLIEAAVQFGLRPGEWAGAEWLGPRRDVLVIANGKRAEELMTRGPFAGRVWKRANGDYRYMRLVGSESEKARSRDLVERMSYHEARTPWAKCERYLQRELRRIIDRAVAAGDLPLRYRKMTIYGARHQFAAAAKGAASIGGGEVAALMGHISIFTAVRSYARRSAGGSLKLAVEPFQECVQAVENRIASPDSSVSSPSPDRRLEHDQASESPPYPAPKKDGRAPPRQ